MTETRAIFRDLKDAGVGGFVTPLLNSPLAPAETRCVTADHSDKQRLSQIVVPGAASVKDCVFARDG